MTVHTQPTLMLNLTNGRQDMSQALAEAGWKRAVPGVELISEYCADCCATTNHEMRIAAEEIECQTCMRVERVGGYFICTKLAEMED